MSSSPGNTLRLKDEAEARIDDLIRRYPTKRPVTLRGQRRGERGGERHHRQSSRNDHDLPLSSFCSAAISSSRSEMRSPALILA